MNEDRQGCVMGAEDDKAETRPWLKLTDAGDGVEFDGDLSVECFFNFLGAMIMKVKDVAPFFLPIMRDAVEDLIAEGKK